jgi:putative peptidoglycan lipid II flippase
MLRTESYKKGVIFSTGLNIVARGVGFINTLVLAYYFGANASTDIYFMVLSIVMIITGIINMIDFLILIPEAMKLREKESEEASRRFLNFFICLYACIGLLIALVVIASPVFFYSVFSKFDSLILHQNNKILYVGSTIILFQLLNNLLNAILSSYKFFTTSILTGLINSLFAIVITVCFHRQLGIVGTISGIAIGYVINFILLASVLKYYQKWKFSQVGWMKKKIIWKNIGIVQLNILPIWLRNYVTLYLLSGLESGIITSVNLAQQVTLILEALLISQVLSVVGIKFSECYSKKDFDKAAELFTDISKILIVFILPLVILVVLYSNEILYFIFAKKSFNENVRTNIELALKYLIVLMPFSMLNSLSTRLFASFQAISKTLVPSIISHSIFLILAVLLITNFGFIGYLYSQIAGFAVLMFLFYIILKKEFPIIKFNEIILFVFKQALFNLAAALCIFQLNKYIFFLNGIALLIIVFLIQYIFTVIINQRNLYISQLFKKIYAFTYKGNR